MWWYMPVKRLQSTSDLYSPKTSVHCIDIHWDCFRGGPDQLAEACRNEQIWDRREKDENSPFAVRPCL